MLREKCKLTKDPFDERNDEGNEREERERVEEEAIRDG